MDIELFITPKDFLIKQNANWFHYESIKNFNFNNLSKQNFIVEFNSTLIFIYEYDWFPHCKYHWIDVMSFIQELKYDCFENTQSLLMDKLNEEFILFPNNDDQKGIIGLIMPVILN